MKKFVSLTTLGFVFISLAFNSHGQHTVARKWNEALLEGIRNDFARPTVHARNLFHTSMAMYDAWAAFDGNAELYLLGKSLNGYKCRFDGIAQPENIQAAQEEAISYACYRLLLHRFANSPGALETRIIIDNLMDELGYDLTFTSTNLEFGEPAALGNYIAQSIIEYGLLDGSNEIGGYTNQFYQPVNEPLVVADPGNPTMTDPNRWQPLTLETFIDQSGNEIPGATPAFLGPEWGQVFPFALSKDDLTIFERDGHEYWVYHNPLQPPLLNADGSGLSDEYKWTFSLVSIWGSHLDPSDGVLWDISPGASGNLPFESLPIEFTKYQNFYNTLDGGTPGSGRDINPKTGQPYAPNMVPRGDYARVLAEFWADGPDSETPPGHWFTILNKVNDDPNLVKKFKGEGPILSDLEWDVKSYFALAGTMHDVAVTAWGIKGWYDYTRPVSAIRYMADKGQSSDQNLPNYSPEGLPLEPGLIELVNEGDPLAGVNNEHVGKIKLYTWKGPDYIADPETDIAGVDWILAENWWPYQRPTFITPPFAGYISGHSTFSRAAAELLTLFTGDEFFPGGLGEFPAPQNNFLVFEKGPSVDVTLQWATYRDASDQTSLSRIWGGIHPPADDIQGRIIGKKIGINAFNLAEQYFLKQVTAIEKNPLISQKLQFYPNPASDKLTINGAFGAQQSVEVIISNLHGQIVKKEMAISNGNLIEVDVSNLTKGVYVVDLTAKSLKHSGRLMVNK